MPDEINEAINGQGTEPSSLPNENQPADIQSETTGELPEGVREKTKAEFEKLKEHNRQLAEQLEAERASKAKQPMLSVLDSLKPTYVEPQAPVLTKEDTGNLPQQKVEDIVAQLTDENGYIDEALLKKTLQDARIQAKKAEERAVSAEQKADQAIASVSRFNQSQTVAKTHADFPEVDPDSEKFNPKLYNLVKNELVGQMLEGREDFYSATKKWVDELGLRTPSESKESVTAKEHINASGASKPDTGVSNDQLVKRTWEGDRDAISERLKKIGL